MTLNEIKALCKESADTGKQIQINEAHSLIEGRWVNLEPDMCVSSFHLPRERFRLGPPKPREWWLYGSNRPIEAGESPSADLAYSRDGWIRVREITEGDK
jgi:hypothetical protein